MLKLNKPYRYSQAEWQHVSTILIPYVRLHGGQKGWDKADNVTKDLNCYEPKNLITSCAVCNMYIKNAGNTIALPAKRRYEQNQFTIVHPYFNDPDIHIKYTNEDRVVIDRSNSTNLGKATIDFLGLNDYPAYAQRAQQFGDMGKYPIDFIKWAKACSAYKRKKKT